MRGLLSVVWGGTSRPWSGIRRTSVGDIGRKLGVLGGLPLLCGELLFLLLLRGELLHLRILLLHLRGADLSGHTPEIATAGCVVRIRGR